MFQVKVKKRPSKLIKQLEKIAKGNFNDFLKPAGGAIRNDVISNIKHQTTPEGGSLKKNSKAWLDEKSRRGWGRLSLIAQFRLLISKSTYVITPKKIKVEITLTKIRRNVGKILEAKGYRFFGISQNIRDQIFESWRKFILSGFK